MTKVQLRFALLHRLDEEHLDAIARVHSVYGIHRVQVEPGLDAVTVEYDASRLNPREVEAELHHAGVPVQPGAVG
jgi:hypothetical protein